MQRSLNTQAIQKRSTETIRIERLIIIIILLIIIEIIETTAVVTIHPIKNTVGKANTEPRKKEKDKTLQ